LPPTAFIPTVRAGGRHVQTTKIDEQMGMIMGTIRSAQAAAQPAAKQTWASELFAFLKCCWCAYITWRIERTALARLSLMSDRELKDIGLSRSQIECAVIGACAIAYLAATTEPFSQEDIIS
jgi:uncharacterized protein YjiS (DUF1127 family)